MTAPLKMKTKRSIDRKKEDRRYVPVIIKRNDESVPHPEDILETAIAEGEEQMFRPKLSLLLSAISAGLILGFSVIVVAFAYMIVPESWGPFAQKLGMALVYPFGFILCIGSRNQLFTEHTALAVYPYLDKRCTFKNLLALWGLVLMGNLIGTFLSSIFIVLAEPITKTALGYVAVASKMMMFSSKTILMSAILAGWLMALGSWLIQSAKILSTQIMCIYIVTFIIGIGGFHHCIVGSAELFVGIFFDNSLFGPKFFEVLVITILGNIIGGSLLVAILNYSHIKKTQEVEIEVLKKISHPHIIE